MAFEPFRGYAPDPTPAAPQAPSNGFYYGGGGPLGAIGDMTKALMQRRQQQPPENPIASSATSTPGEPLGISPPPTTAGVPPTAPAGVPGPSVSPAAPPQTNYSPPPWNPSGGNSYAPPPWAGGSPSGSPDTMNRGGFLGLGNIPGLDKIFGPQGALSTAMAPVFGSGSPLGQAFPSFGGTGSTPDWGSSLFGGPPVNRQG